MPARDIPARQGSLRAHNLAVVLRQVATSTAPVSRASIAASSGLTRATVSAIVDELISGGLVTFASAAPAGVGRPGVGVRLAGARPAGLGMEVNVDYVAACVVDLAGDTRHREVVFTDQRGRSPGQAWESLEAIGRQALAVAAAKDLTITNAAVALPGLIEDRTVHIAPNLGWRQVPLPATIAGLPVGFGNEANLAAFGELHASSLRSFIYVSGEIGIGAGIVVNAELFGGTRGWAGELGHVTVDPVGKPCRCGSQGCLEQYAGEDAIREAAGLSDAEQLIDRAGSGDHAILRALAGAGSALGVALSTAVNLLDLPAVVLGGHFAPLAHWLAPAIELELRRRVITASWSPPLIQPSVLGADASVIGAARVVTQAIIDNPAGYLTSIRH